MDGLKMQLSCIREIINTNLYTTPISLISRLYYIFQGAYNRETGAIQFQFHDGSILFCDVGADGEQLALSNQKWQDPFREPLSPINQTYVQEHGKWCLVDVSIEEPYSNIIGTTLRSCLKRSHAAQSAKHESDHRTINHAFARRGAAFVIFA